MPHTDPNLWIAWLIPLFPLIGYLLNAILGNKQAKVVYGAIATVVVFVSFGIACYLFRFITSQPEDARQFTVYLAPWLGVPPDVHGTLPIQRFQVNWELLIDPLSVLMMLIITGVGGLIHLYSTAYMAADPGYPRFFRCLNLFIFFMLLLVMGNNMLMMFVGWEGVGLCSYLLIGYFYEKQSASDAAKKAMIVNRIGDVGVLIGMFFIFHYFGTLDFITGQSGVPGILQAAPQLLMLASGAVITTMLLMLFFGCTGKSAQIPLYTWLPDAMEGPTPVSALIHAATMVTAGVYLVSRMHSLFELSDTAMVTVAVIGIATALFAATIGLMQNDIKRVLAYSTVSQLGYMFAACGAGVFAAGMFHVMTHAFFKACLFLGSGSVIHAIEHGMHHAHGQHADENAAHAEHGDSADAQGTGSEGPDPNDPQDMRNMGGLAPRIRITWVTMLAATLAIAGFFPFAGYWSKDQILWSAYQTHGNSVLGIPANVLFYAIGAITALITAFYMMRMMMKTYAGAPRTEAAKNAHESSPAMTIPLIILAVLSFVAGWPILPLNFEKFAEYLKPSVSTPGYLGPQTNPGSETMFGVGLFIVIAIVLAICYSVYRSSKNGLLLSPQARAGFPERAVFHKYWVDEAYNFWFVKLGKKFSYWLWQTFDVGIVDGIVNGVASVTNWSGDIVRRFQNGYVRSYAFSMVLGILIVLIGCLAGLGYVR